LTLVEVGARPMLVAAMNACPCGYRSHPRQSCRCSRQQIARYHHKLSGPLLDRLDVHVRVLPVEVQALSGTGDAEPSSSVRARVVAARERQLQRYAAGVTRHRTNAELSLEELEAVAPLERAARRWLEKTAHDLGWSARAWVKILRVARTIADLEGTEPLRLGPIEEAALGRLLDSGRLTALGSEEAS
jgi:magnesium chelatase family protein